MPIIDLVKVYIIFVEIKLNSATHVNREQAAAYKDHCPNCNIISKSPSIMRNFFQGIPKQNSVSGYVIEFTKSRKENLSLIKSNLQEAIQGISEQSPDFIMKYLNKHATRLQIYCLYNPDRQDTQEESEDEGEPLVVEEEPTTLKTIESKVSFMNSISKLKPKGKLEGLLNYCTQDQQIMALLSGQYLSNEGHKSWFHQIIQRPFICLSEHHGGDVDEFLKQHDNFTLSKHYKTCQTKKPCTATTCAKN